MRDKIVYTYSTCFHYIFFPSASFSSQLIFLTPEPPSYWLLPHPTAARLPPFPTIAERLTRASRQIDVIGLPRLETLSVTQCLCYFFTTAVTLPRNVHIVSPLSYNAYFESTGLVSRLLLLPTSYNLRERATAYTSFCNTTYLGRRRRQQ